ncbi:hypothetical protein AJ80_01752 [Polytolypa hystricis UAMH7299]|uniref:USP domain-containing protein n=1 Tax=Polytolypa hystricis (strain UAMH7299) TaxID=1447883 RepID=A0A2B7Z072_POLH7|nr:hypothetical protein AJ80_01752 [Polytolypa hystricis UAMH7299]
MAIAQFGCEHLKAHFESDEKTAGQLSQSLLHAHTVLSLKPTVRRAAVNSKSASSSGLSLMPSYPCLQCSTVCGPAAREGHHASSGHLFFTDSRTGAIFCQGCKDFIYDEDLEKFLLEPSHPALKASKKRSLDSSDTEDDKAYLSAHASKRVCGMEGVRGLFNLGQSCYMNAIVQAFLHDPLLTAYFLGNGHPTFDCSEPDCVSCGLAEAFAEFNNEEKTEGFGVSNLLAATWRPLAGCKQQDALEFYQFAVDKLHTGANDFREDFHVKCRCFFHKALYGKLHSTVTCDVCGNVTQAEDPILDLSLDLQLDKKTNLGGKPGKAGSNAATAPTPSLEACLKSFIAPEKIAEVNCSGCGGNSDRVTRQVRIKRLPVTLCIQLKRWAHTPKASQKFQGKITFPLALNMLPYTTRPNAHNISNYVYDLSSAVVHQGQLNFGHYYAYCRQGEQWHLFNDDRVTPATEAQVLNSDAYLLFYTLRSLPKHK